MLAAVIVVMLLACAVGFALFQVPAVGQPLGVAAFGVILVGGIVREIRKG